MKLTNYFIHYNWFDLLYYSSQGILKDEHTFLNKEFLDDYMKGVLTKDATEEIIESLTPKQQAALYEYADSLIDPFAPEESLVDLLDMIDPYYTHSQGGDL